MKLLQLLAQLLLVSTGFTEIVRVSPEAQQHDPLRVIGGKLYDFGNVIEIVLAAEKDGKNQNLAVLSHQVGRRYMIRGSINQITDSGLHVYRFVGLNLNLEWHHELSFVHNYPNRNSLVDGQRVLAYALPVAPYRFLTVSGSESVIPAWDYGTVFKGDPYARFDSVTRLLPNGQVTYKLVPKASATSASPTAADNQNLVTEKVINWQMQRASEGSPSAQYDLGLRYLKGDGVPKNEKTGIEWIGKASTNGHLPAKKYLESLQQKKN